MGKEINKSIIIHSWKDLVELSKEICDIYINEFNQRIIETGCYKNIKCVSMNSIINGRKTIFVGPSGSKEGWDVADIFDEFYSHVIEHIESKKHEDGSNSYGYVYLEYGDEGSRIINTNYTNLYTEHCNVKYYFADSEYLTFYECDCLYNRILKNDKYCGNCGKPIEWGDVDD